MVDGGEYDNYGWDGVYATAEAAMAAYPGRGTTVEQSHMVRPGGWLPMDNPRYKDGEWWNGFNGDFGKHIHAVEVQE